MQSTESDVSMPRTLPSWLSGGFFVGLFLALVVAWGGGFLGHRMQAGRVEAATETPLTVRLHTVTPGARSAGLARSGTLVAAETAQIASRRLAAIATILPQEGDTVGVGQVLVRLDARDLEARQAATHAAVSAANEAEAVAKVGLVRARARQATAEVTWQRVQTLHADGGATAHDLTVATGDRQMARAETAQALRQIEAAQARMAEARAQARLSEADLADATLISPFAGVVVKRHLDSGAMAAPGQAILSLERAPYRLEVHIEATRTVGLVVGTPVTVTLEAPPRRIIGHISRVVPAIDPASQTAVVKVTLPPEAHQRLRSGVYAQVNLPEVASQTLSLPADAVVRWYNLTSAFVLASDGRAERRLIRLGERFDTVPGGAFEVLDGLSAGERVVRAAPPALRDGMPVRQAP